MKVQGTFGESFYTFKKDLNDSPARVGRGVAEVVRRVTAGVVRGAKIGAPVDTGNLRASYSADIVGDGRSGSISSEIGPTAEYGVFVELGTSRMDPQPHLGPAFDSETASLEAILGAVVGRSLS